MSKIKIDLEDLIEVIWNKSSDTTYKQVRDTENFLQQRKELETKPREITTMHRTNLEYRETQEESIRQLANTVLKLRQEVATLEDRIPDPWVAVLDDSVIAEERKEG